MLRTWGDLNWQMGSSEYCKVPGPENWVTGSAHRLLIDRVAWDHQSSNFLLGPLHAGPKPLTRGLGQALPLMLPTLTPPPQWLGQGVRKAPAVASAKRTSILLFDSVPL